MKCAIVTPIGPGHRQIFEAVCKPSVAVAMGYHMGPFTEITHLAMDDGEGRHGRSARRNTAIAEARTAGVDWLFFLDADDVLAPNAFEAFGRALAADAGLDAIWGLICEYDADGAPSLREGQPERLETIDDFLAVPPYLAVQIGMFLRTDCAARFGFDTGMDTGEDYRLYLQLWRNCRCAKVPEIFFINRRGQHSTGPRAATGADWSRSVEAQWAAALARTPIWSRVEHEGVDARMRVSNPLDLIQNSHLRGRFFEADALRKLHQLVPEGAHIVDVGANIGNHVIWYGQHLKPARIYPVEPNPVAIAILEANMAANDLGGVIDARGVGLGVGAEAGRFSAITDDPDNLGATRLVADPAGKLRVVSIDALMGDARVDFLKIDAEGMEIEVLAGAAAVIARDRPVIWVETLRQNILAFAQLWCRANDYCLVDSVANVNAIDYFAMPRERA